MKNSFCSLNPLKTSSSSSNGKKKMPKKEYQQFLKFCQTTDFRLAFQKLHEYCIKNQINFPNEYLKYVEKERLYPIYCNKNNKTFNIYDKPYFYHPKSKIQYCGSYTKTEIEKLIQSKVLKNFSIDSECIELNDIIQ